jgi:hypothetical protein
MAGSTDDRNARGLSKILTVRRAPEQGRFLG